MNYLLDSHIFLWSIFDPTKISKKLKETLLISESTYYISVVTFWEISIKFGLGKIDLKKITPDKLPIVAQKDGFKILNLDAETTSSFYKLPKIPNKDPFDRMLAWQAIRMDYILLTTDRSFSDYKEHGLRVIA